MNNEAIIEGLLYVQGDEGLTIKQVMEVLEIDEKKALEEIYKVKTKFDRDDHGIRVNFLGNTFKFTTKEEHKNYYSKLYDNNCSSTLSQVALETLAIIAYNQPITRIKLDELRGVDNSYQVRKLAALGLIKECGKADLPGRPTLYKTTDEFLDYFGINSLDELPDIKMDDDTLEEDNLFMSNYKENV